MYKSEKRSPPTFIDDGLLLPEIGESRKFSDAILFGESLVVDFDEIHTERIGIVVNLFKFFEYLVASGTTSSICKVQIEGRLIK